MLRSAWFRSYSPVLTSPVQECPVGKSLFSVSAFHSPPYFSRLSCSTVVGCRHTQVHTGHGNFKETTTPCMCVWDYVCEGLRIGRQLKFRTLQNSPELEISSRTDMKPHSQYIHTPSACALGYGLNRDTLTWHLKHSVWYIHMFSQGEKKKKTSRVENAGETIHGVRTQPIIQSLP